MTFPSHPTDGGEGNRTPDLLNAIQALSQLSYTPGIPSDRCTALGEPRRISEGNSQSQETALEVSVTASILQRPASLRKNGL